MARRTKEPAGRTETAESDRALLRDWLKGLMIRYKAEPKQLADAGGVAVSTVYRWLDPNATISPQLHNVLRIARSFGAATPGLTSGFAEPDVKEFEGETPETLTPRTSDQSVWRIGSRALELAGALPGDLVLLDQAAGARPGDLVIAQIYDFAVGSAETKVRLYDGYSLVTRTLDPTAQDRAIPVDGERAVIVGRIMRLHRTYD